MNCNEDMRSRINSPGRGKSTTILTADIDLANNVFAVHDVNELGTALLRQPKVARVKLNALVASLPPIQSSRLARAHTTGRGSATRAEVQPSGAAPPTGGTNGGTGETV